MVTPNRRKTASQHLAMEANPENVQPEPINVTGDLTIQDRMKLVSGITREIKHQVKPESANPLENISTTEVQLTTTTGGGQPSTN